MSRKDKVSQVSKTPIHQWTNGGNEVLILRCIDKNGKSYGGFQNPLEVGAVLTVPDVWDKAWGPQPGDWKAGWVSDTRCGGGMHGWAWGIGIGDGKDPDWTGLWQVYAVSPADVIGNVDGGRKVKFRTGVLRYSGHWRGAMLSVLTGQMAWVAYDAKGAAASSGDRSSAASSGDSSSAASSGYRSSAASSGDSSSASAVGESSPAVCAGLNSRARAGEFGCIALAWWNEKEQRSEMRCAQTGAGKGSLKANVWYRLNDAGEFVESE